MSGLAWMLGASWGVLAATPVARRGRRGTVAGRLRSGEHAARRVSKRWRPVADASARLAPRLAAWSGPVARVLHDVRSRRAFRGRDALVARELPVALDLLGVAVDAGCTPYLAVETAARWTPPVLARELTGVRRACALGASFEQALDDVVRDVPTLRSLADALLASDRLGAPVAPALTRLAAEERVAARRRAETHARRVPVRLLFPLVFLVLPAFVLLTVVPGLAAGLARL